MKFKDIWFKSYSRERVINPWYITCVLRVDIRARKKKPSHRAFDLDEMWRVFSRASSVNVGFTVTGN